MPPDNPWTHFREKILASSPPVDLPALSSGRCEYLDFRLANGTKAIRTSLMIHPPSPGVSPTCSGYCVTFIVAVPRLRP
jgi:hypothetical protein